MEKDFQILLVEDNEADAFLMQEVFQEGDFQSKLNIVSDGVEALDFLLHRERFSNSPRPDLILLDLNMPRKDGREVLKEVKADPKLRSIPIIVLTTSESEEDVKKSYDSFANCYITKPMGLDEMYEVIKGIEHFWFKLATLPG